MGEYAKRKSDEQMVKIGTWPNMYYLRHDQKNKVEYDILSKEKRKNRTKTKRTGGKK